MKLPRHKEDAPRPRPRKETDADVLTRAEFLAGDAMRGRGVYGPATGQRVSERIFDQNAKRWVLHVRLSWPTAGLRADVNMDTNEVTITAA